MSVTMTKHVVRWSRYLLLEVVKYSTFQNVFAFWKVGSVEVSGRTCPHCCGALD